MVNKWIDKYLRDLQSCSRSANTLSIVQLPALLIDIRVLKQLWLAVKCELHVLEAVYATLGHRWSEQPMLKLFAGDPKTAQV
jgi:hypothetical protein